MITLQGIPITDLAVWGWPWHGQLIKQDTRGDVYALRRHDGEVWPLYNVAPALSRITPALLFALNNYKGAVEGANGDSGSGPAGTTHLVRVAGHVVVPRTPDELVIDRTRSHDWLGATMLCGTKHRCYMTPLGELQWIYNRPGERWLMRITVDACPRRSNSLESPLTLTVSARPFGVFGVPGEWQSCGAVTAPTCHTSTPNFRWFGPGLPEGDSSVMLQSIRSDGGQLILEVGGYALMPAPLSRAAIGFYRLDITGGPGEWGLALTLLKRDSDVVRKVLVSNPLALGGGSLDIETVILEDGVTAVHTPIPKAVDDKVICIGTLVQEEIIHCGYVYDADDVLHEIESVIRASHACSVPASVLTMSGSASSRHVHPVTTCLSNDILAARETDNRVVTTLTAEIRRDGEPVSSVSCTLTATLTAQETFGYSCAGVVSGENTTNVQTNVTITVGGHSASRSEVRTEFGLGGTDTSFWPHTGIFSPEIFAERVSTLGLNPWPRPVFGNQPGGMVQQGVPGFNDALRIGAARQSNNVWVPVIVAGSWAGVLNRWWQISDGGGTTVIEGLPASVFGQRVGPDSNGLAPADFVPVGGVGPEKIEGGAYDYLHRVVLPYADIF